METFDYKPRLQQDNGKLGRKTNTKLLGSRWKFKQHGSNGTWVSELLPNLAKQTDHLCVIRSMTTDSENHPQAVEQLHTGSFQSIRPSLGAWTVHALGTQNQNLPGFISLNPVYGLGGLRCYSNAFLPASTSATLIGDADLPKKDASVGNLVDGRLAISEQRNHLDLIASLNQRYSERTGDPKPKEASAAFELAFRMQAEMPGLMDISKESKQTHELYGIGQEATDNMARQCLLARRLSEAGVRFVEISHSDWDHHSSLAANLSAKCREIDQPIAALLADLHQRGLLKDTLIIWGGEFGRTPDDATSDGRGHNAKGFTMWLAGGGVRGGTVFGNTDELGYEAIENKVHLHDLHATMLHQLGIDHEKLTYKHGGRDFRLTDTAGNVIKAILS